MIAPQSCLFFDQAGTDTCLLVTVPRDLLHRDLRMRILLGRYLHQLILETIEKMIGASLIHIDRTKTDLL